VPAVIEAVRAIRREKIEYILTSCPPYSAHLVGLLAKWTTGVRWWVADFRDPWMTTGTKALSPTCSASLGIERWMERAVVGNADRIVTNTEMLCEGLKRAYDSIPKERFACITNGFDRDFFSRFAHLQKERTFTIIYAGSFYFGRTPEPVFQAVHDLLREGAVARQDVRIRLVGHCRSVEGRPIDELIERYRLRDVVEVLEPVSYNKAIAMIRQSHLALLLAPNQPYQVPAKIYDYLGAGTRVLALAREGATADFIRNTAIGAVFDPSDTAGIKGFIRQSVEACGTSDCWINPDATSPFELDSISRRLADELNRLCVVEPCPERVLRTIGKSAIRSLIPLSMRKRMAIWVHQQKWIHTDRRSWWSVELVRDFAEKDVNGYHKFLWAHHLGYAAPYEVATRFGVEKIRPSRQVFFSELRHSMQALGRSPRDVRSVLEVGCSLGYQLRYLETELFPGADVLDGIDIDRHAIQSGQEHLGAMGSRISLTCGDIQQLDELLGGRVYDLILCAGVLMYLKEADADKLVRAMLSHSRVMVALAGLAHPVRDNAALERSEVRARDQTFIHNFDGMVKNAGGTVLARRWEGDRQFEGQTIYFVFAASR
jgi:glycosyltransferase involved in cell wall biosynthesis/2-polyprenyl-3-methyl-5-hydroxy-6-metoxy-1,4-benzoquinol methylase